MNISIKDKISGKLKTSSILLLGMIAFLSGIFSCTKTPINGNLDGEWEVVEVTPAPPVWDEKTRIFYNFQLHVCQLTFYGYPFTNGNLSYNGETITMDFPYIRTPDEKFVLKQYGIFSNPVSFNVYFENKNRLILSNDETTVVLKKF